MKKIITTALATMVAVCGYSQTYLPLTGGTLTGNLSINTPANSSFITANQATPTALSYGYITNNNTGLQYGIEGSVPGSFCAGTTQYAAVVNANYNRNLEFGSNNAVRFRIGADGTSSFLGPLTGTSATFNSGGNYTMEAISNQRYILQLRNASNSFNPGFGWWLGQDDNGKFVVHLAGNGDKFTLDPSGNASFHAQGTAGSGSLNIISPDSFIRLNSTNGTPNKQKWDLRSISAPGSEGLEFRTINDDNTQFSSKMFINHNGNVGIGTNSPTNYGVNTTTLSIANPSGGSFLDFYNAGLRTGHIYASSSKFSINTVVLPGEVFPDLELGTVGGVNMTLKPFGNVGIGNTSPSATLEVSRGSGSGGTAVFRGTNRYSHFNYSTEEDTYIRGGKSTSNVYINDNGGNVGIGTTNPQGYKLAVAGNVIAESVKVALQGAWPDYVFKADAKLLSLPAVEQFVQQNNHLPEMPSEAEVKKEGIDLGQMDAKLLKKIEELTLYMIDFNKKMEVLQKEATTIKEENQSLKKEIAQLKSNK